MMLICVFSSMYRNQWQSQQKPEQRIARGSESAPVEKANPRDTPENTGEILLQAEDDEMNITISVDIPS